MYTHVKRPHTHVKDPVRSPCPSSVDSGNTRITQHALKVSVIIMVKLGTCTKEEEDDKFGKVSAVLGDTDSIVIYILRCLLLTVTLMSAIVIYILNCLLLTVTLMSAIVIYILNCLLLTVTLALVVL